MSKTVNLMQQSADKALELHLKATTILQAYQQIEEHRVKLAEELRVSQRQDNESKARQLISALNVAMEKQREAKSNYKRYLIHIDSLL